MVNKSTGIALAAAAGLAGGYSLSQIGSQSPSSSTVSEKQEVIVENMPTRQLQEFNQAAVAELLKRGEQSVTETEQDADLKPGDPIPDHAKRFLEKYNDNPSPDNLKPGAPIPHHADEFLKKYQQ